MYAASNIERGLGGRLGIKVGIHVSRTELGWDYGEYYPGLRELGGWVDGWMDVGCECIWMGVDGVG